MITVTDEEMNSLSRAVHARYGIDFTHYEPKSFKRRITKVIESCGFDSVNSLWIKILKEPRFIYEFIDGITVGLTELFRNPSFWTELRDKTLVEYEDKKELSVWHAGCSTGEEVYSLGILLREQPCNFKVNAWATDINRKSLDNAKKGGIPKSIMEKYDTNYRQFSRRSHGLSNYVAQEDERNYYLDTTLVDHVKFGIHNLVSGKVSGRYDIIFCRNVLIYFDKTLQERILRTFHALLNEGGSLVVGYYDSNPNAFGDLFEVANPVTKTYRKIAEAQPQPTLNTLSSNYFSH